MGGKPASESPHPDFIDETKLFVPFHKTDPIVSSSKTCGYEFAFKIGEGAFSDVRAAYRKDDDRKIVCIKEINMAYYTKEYAIQSPYEFNILSQLSHPDILKIYEVFSSKKIYYMVSELFCGGELFDSICQRDRYSEEDARRVMRTVAESMRYCHKRKVIHRDIKPENLILVDKSRDSKVKLIDFGFARVMTDQPFTDLRGSAMYLSPEMIAGSYGLQTDVWSLGVVFFIMLSGVYPFESATGDVEETKEIITRGKFTFSSRYWAGVSMQARDLVSRMLCMDCDERITMAGVLEHPWIVNQQNKEVDISSSIATIKTFQQNRKMKSTSLAVRATLVFKSNGIHLLKEKMKSKGKLRLQSVGDSLRETGSESSRRLSQCNDASEASDDDKGGHELAKHGTHLMLSDDDDDYNTGRPMTDHC